MLLFYQGRHPLSTAGCRAMKHIVLKLFITSMRLLLLTFKTVLFQTLFRFHFTQTVLKAPAQMLQKILDKAKKPNPMSKWLHSLFTPFCPTPDLSRLSYSYVEVLPHTIITGSSTCIVATNTLDINKLHEFTPETEALTCISPQIKRHLGPTYCIWNTQSSLFTKRNACIIEALLGK